MVAADLSALQVAVRENPTDGLARLALADAIEESGWDDFGPAYGPLQREIGEALSISVVRLRREYAFFRKHAGGIVGGNAHYALDLARAERAAQELDFCAEWGEDDWEWDGDGEAPEELLYCMVRFQRVEDDYCTVDENGIETGEIGAEINEVASLCSIGDPDANYRRVIEAELALEVLAQI